MYTKREYFLIILILLVILPTAGGANSASLIRNNVWLSNLSGVFYGSLALGDIDNDGDPDLIGMGCTSGGFTDCATADKIRIYTNNGTIFNENSTWESNTTNLGYGSLSLGDIDNDGDLDFVIMGDQGLENGVVKIYINNGTTFNEDLGWEANFSGINAFNGAIALGDINNDGKLDLALAGAYPADHNRIYINNGTSFVRNSNWLENFPLAGFGGGGAAIIFADYNNDDKLDLAFAGSRSTNFYANIYINNGSSLINNSSFANDFTATFGFPSLAVGDYNNDGFIDLAAIGARAGDHLKFYKNSGINFSLQIENSGENSLAGYLEGSIAFGDFDNDGDLDFAAMGRESERNKIYTNNNSIFEVDIFEQQDMYDDDMQWGGLAWVDVNGDNNLDLIINGKNGSSSNLLFKVYISNASLTKNNTKPNPPNSSFSAIYINNILTLSWGNGSDVETNTSGLYYNLRVGNATNNNSIVSGVYGGSSNPTSGYFGNMMQRKSIRLNVQLEANKTYYWYVQTIDTGLAKSNWSALQTFNTSLDITKPNITINYPSPNANLHTTNPYFIFNISVTDANLTNVTLYANFNGTMLANETNSSGINGTYTFIRNLTSYSDRMYSWYIYACDGTNNCQTSGRSFYLDRTAPIVRAISPVDSGTWTESNSVVFPYNVTDTDIANCSLIVDGNIVNTSTSVNENIEQNLSYPLSNGNYNWNINCTDYVGYTNSSETRSLTVSYTTQTSAAGGGGGGIADTTPKTYAVTAEHFLQGYTKELSKSDKIEFSINNKNHSLLVNSVNEILNYANLTLNSTPFNFLIYVNETKKFELTNDNFYDLLVKLNNLVENKANLTIKSIYEKIPAETEEKETGKEVSEEEKKEEKPLDVKKYLVFLVISIIIIVILIIYSKKYLKYKSWKKWTLLG